MSNTYAAKLPPAMVTVANGFGFSYSSGTMDDSDVSSLNTTPSKSSVDRKVIGLAPGEIDESDLDLKLSRANPINPYRIPGEKDSSKPFDESSENNEQQDSTKNSLPSQVLVQIDRVQDAIPLETKGNDPRVVNDQENHVNKNREAVLKDRKEKYRRIAAEPTTASTRRMRGDGKLNSWKKKADERRTQAERVMPWYVPADAPDDYDPADAPDDEADEVISAFKLAPDDAGDMVGSSLKASKHLVQDEPKQECYPESKQEKEKTKAPAEIPESAPDNRRKNRSVMTFMKRSKAPWGDSLVKAPFSPDMYGCPIFHVESEEEEEGEPQGDLTEVKAKLNEFDEANIESIASMLSNASFFAAKAVAQKLTEDASNFLDKTGQAVEDIVLGPLEEVDESAILNTSSETDDSESPPPPKSPPRKYNWWLEDELDRRRANSESPKKTERARVSFDSERKQFANVEALVAEEAVEVEKPAEADIVVRAESEIVDTSFVLDDASDVDVTHILNESSMDDASNDKKQVILNESSMDDASNDKKQVNELAQSNAQELRTAKATVNMFDWQAQQRALKEKDRMRKKESAEFLHSYRGNTAETNSKSTSIKQEDAAHFLRRCNSAKEAVELNSSPEADEVARHTEEAVNKSAFLNTSSAPDENEKGLTTSFVLSDLSNLNTQMNKATDKKDDELPTARKILVSPEGAKLLEGAVRALIECSFLNSSSESSFVNTSSDAEYLELSRPPSNQDEKACLGKEIESSPENVKEFPMEETRLATVNEQCTNASEETTEIVEYGSQGVSTEKELETEEAVVPKNVESPEVHNSSSNESQCGEDAVDPAQTELVTYTERSVVPAFDYESKQAEDLSFENPAEDISQNEPTQGVIADMEQNAPRDSSDTEARDYHATAVIVAGAAALATVPASPVTMPVGDSVSQPIVSDESKETLPEFKISSPEFPPPPTDDADLEFDLASIVTQSTENTPVRNNLDESKVVASKAKAKKSKVPAVASLRPKTAKKTSVKEAAKTKSVVDAAKSKPAMVKTLDDTNGIAKGDIFISLLNSNLNEANRAPKGADQVRDAIFRMRSMRRRQEKVEMVHLDPEETHRVPTPSKRSVLPVNLDDTRVVSSVEHIKTLEEEAIEHLKRDEIDAAIELYTEIASTYAESFIETENKKQKLSRKKPEKDRQSGYKAYIGAVLHNIGILHLLKFDFDKALYHFIRAATNRKIHFGVGSVDHLASLSKIAVCYYAMNDFEEAHKGLEEVLELSKNHLAGLTDFMQIAETLNNLGVLSFMCGQSEAAMTMFKECSEIQNAVLKQSLYGGPRFGGHATSLAISVTRGNVGYIRMLTKNAGAAIVEFESSLMHQQMILSDSHDTVICSMDHLAVTHLLAHNKEEATKMLSRMLRAQLDAYGPDDERCVLTLSKLQLVQTRKTDYLEKALEQLWRQHTSASISSKSSKLSTNTKSKNMLKKFSFVKKVGKLSH